MYKIKVTTKDGLVVLVSVDNIVNLAEGDFITKVEVIKNQNNSDLPKQYYFFRE